jgi:hypothetical protein
MRRDKWLAGILLAIALPLTSGCKAPYSNPSETFKDNDLVGMWEGHYGDWGFDRLNIRPDGTFKQVYQDNTAKGYMYETPWNKWWVERFSDGRARLHLQGARYYLYGIRRAELNGMDPPCSLLPPNCLVGEEPQPASFYDPIAQESVKMIKELVLNVRSDSGKIILMHMWIDSDGGFAMIGGEREEFRRLGTP